MSIQEWIEQRLSKLRADCIAGHERYKSATGEGHLASYTELCELEGRLKELRELELACLARQTHFVYRRSGPCLDLTAELLLNQFEASAGQVIIKAANTATNGKEGWTLRTEE